MSLPPALALYRAATQLLGLLAAPVLGWRAGIGKEDPARVRERRGYPGAPRPEGPLVWLHGASVGESLVLLTLVEALWAERPDLNILVTTGTVTSAAMMARRLPQGVIHQFAPVDRPRNVRRFLDHWRPDLAVFAESELWPNLLLQAKARGMHLALVNARMNARSLDQWLKWRRSGRMLLGAFDWIGAADRRTSEGLSVILGAPVPLAGNLKLEAQAPAPDPDSLAAVKAALGGRPAWLAASTHAGEEEIVLQAHGRLSKTHPGALLILAPRHPDRGDEIARLIASGGFSLARRSAGETPGPETDVWLADTLGEMPLWYALAPAAFIGGSLIDGIGGHNPVEASRAGACVITGPHAASFDDVYAAYFRHGAALRAGGAPSLAAAVDAVWNMGAPDAETVAAALRDASGGALETTLNALRPLLPEARR